MSQHILGHYITVLIIIHSGRYCNNFHLTDKKVQVEYITQGDKGLKPIQSYSRVCDINHYYTRLPLTDFRPPSIQALRPTYTFRKELTSSFML